MVETQGTAASTTKADTPGWTFDDLLMGLALHFFAQLNLTEDADKQLSDLKLGRTHHRVLYICHRKPGVTSGEITKTLRITNQALNRPMRELIETGYVEQRVSPVDRRQRLHYSTETGAELFQQLAQLQTERLRRAYEASTPAAVEGFLDVLRHVASDEDLAFLDVMQMTSSTAN
ncbi:MarR family winged helix-turn-helix transcriptional regulator [Chachezhania sediminis]|uniref:MarR family winged helix-turn-helix transcriptional regulator n=1 Tax=Chachezhania sediminis TaxID=2599291 RepID=UPI00131D14C8|nr:MarR family transcriptional regulator [Chachezhania sediminis]